MSTRHPARTAAADPTQSISAQQTTESHHPLEYELLDGFDASTLAGLSVSQLIDLLASDLELIEEVEHPASGMHQLLQAVQAQTAETQAEAGLPPVAQGTDNGETRTLRMADALSDRDREAATDEAAQAARVTELERAARRLSEFAEELDQRAVEMIGRDEESLRTAGDLLDAQQDLIHRLDELQHQLDQLEQGDSENRSRSVA